ncbi:Uncharacterised protein [Levilactobacillus brevis]|nr:Uncharacterised protein [Levilactobacillus brevis]
MTFWPTFLESGVDDRPFLDSQDHHVSLVIRQACKTLSESVN